MQIVSRNKLLEMVNLEPHVHKAVVIHETGKYGEVREIVSLLKDSVVLEMDDVISQTGATSTRNAPTKEMVERAVKSGFDIVSCRAGISRSAAIGFLIECTKKSPEEAIQILDPTHHYPNELVLKLGQEILDVNFNPVVCEFYKKVAAHRGWSWEPHNLVTKYFKG